MKELEYPFDSKDLMRKKRKYKRELLEDNSKRITKKIAVLGGSTTNDIVDILELFLLNYGIQPLFYQSEYGKYWEDAVFDNQELDVFKPDIIFVHTTCLNIESFPALSDDISTVEEMRTLQFDKYCTMWDALIRKYHCPIIQNNFELPFTRIIGNRDNYAIGGKTNFINKLNLLFSDYANSHEDFYINDINYQSANIGLEVWYDPFAWYMYKYAVSLEAIPSLAFNVANIIKSIYGKNKKALAIDLDNTLWGGIVGDDGVEGLKIGHETAVGQIFEEFQQYLKQIKTNGIILNIISKNEKDNALAGLNHPSMVLKPDDFILIKANWDPKSQNLIKMAEELSLGVDSFVFVDDNPAEREIIRQQVPGVGVPELEKPEQYIRAIDNAGFFEMTSFSEDDKKRNEMYRANVQRASLKRQFADYSEYLKSLEMVAEIKPFQPIYIERIAQLTNKSNQFNLTTLRCTREEIETISEDDRFITFYGKLEDKFGDNGVVTVAIGEKKEQTLDMILWIMSCRVLKRDLEFALMDKLVDKAKDEGITTVIGHYYPTKKNRMVRDFYAGLGFDLLNEDDEGNRTWKLSIESYQKKNCVIRIKEN